MMNVLATPSPSSTASGPLNFPGANKVIGVIALHCGGDVDDCYDIEGNANKSRRKQKRLWATKTKKESNKGARGGNHPFVA
jgi:hypothetical protein